MEEFLKTYGSLTVSIVTALITVGTILWKGGVLSGKIQEIDTGLKDLKIDSKKDHDILVEGTTTIKFIREELTKLDVEVKGFRNEIPQLRTDMNKLLFSQSKSPLALNPRGQKLLTDSGIAPLIESRIDEIVKYVQDLNPQNAYEVQQQIIEYTRRLVEVPELKNQIEMGAFRAGEGVYSVLYVAAIHVRDVVLQRLGMSDDENMDLPT